MIGVGEYIRSNKGQIDRLQYEINNNWRSKDNDGNIIARCEKNKYCLENIVNHSKNIIDLIEVEDYVNGYKVLEVCPERGWIEVECNKPSAETTIWKNEIKSILTHEQYRQNAYEVEK